MGQVLNVFLLGGVGDQYGCIVNMYLLEGQLNYRLCLLKLGYILFKIPPTLPPPLIYE